MIGSSYGTGDVMHADWAMGLAVGTTVPCPLRDQQARSHASALRSVSNDSWQAPVNGKPHTAGRTPWGLPQTSPSLNVREDFGRYPVGLHRGDEGGADGPAGSAHGDGGDDAEPGMVIDPGDDLALAAVSQEQARGDIQLPQVHRDLALPAHVLLAAPAPGDRLDELIADQDPVDRDTAGYPRRSSSNTSRLGPHRRCARRSSQITASTSAAIRHGCAIGACERSASPGIPSVR